MADRRDIVAFLREPIDARSLAVFRVAFGLVMFAASVRFLASGWIDRFYGDPQFFFKYWGFSWVEVPPVGWIYALHVALAVLALCIAAGLFYRPAALLFTLGFSYAELFDVTNYLNHYYLVSLLGLLCVIVPLHRRWSIDARLRPALASQTLPRWCLWLFRAQVGTVYVYAGLAKLGSDWLLEAQPLNLWLTARVDTPIIGPLLDHVWVAYAASWFGFLFDLTIVFWLSWRRSRPYAYVVLLGFHTMTGVLFNIGMFPWIMTAAATVFFDPAWPSRPVRLWRRVRPAATAEPAPMIPAPVAPATRAQRAGIYALAVYVALQVLVPLRHFAYPGDVLWNEQGMRWSWKVKLREKHGAVTYYVRFVDTGKELQVSPRRYLVPRQEREMAGQPDLILQLAHHIRDDFAARGHRVEVRAEALVSLNGRPARHLIDPTVDLASVSDGVSVADWILPAPSDAPIHVGRR